MAYGILKPVCALLLAALFLTNGCCAPREYIQLRMADPMVLPDETGRLNPPTIAFQKYRIKTTRSGDKTIDFTRLQGSPITAVIAWENPAEHVKTRVDLEANAAYRVQVKLPENYEYRRLALLRAKLERLYEAIDDADRRLRENTTAAAQLLTPEARQSLIAARDEERLRLDDIARDRLLPQELVDSLVDQIEAWRAELNLLKSRVVALELMVNNPNDPYPRVINGWVETFERTTFATAGALPFIIEDDYLDWIRQDKVVTIVTYDPNEAPENPQEARLREGLPSYWPSGQLTVVQFIPFTTGVPRADTGGVRANTEVRTVTHLSVRSENIRAGNGHVRTYLRTGSGQIWAFGPDLESPRDIEVWLQDASGAPTQKLYPPDGRSTPRETFVSQIAGAEGGAYDPIQEARKRGRILAVTRLGNMLGTNDYATIHGTYAREMDRARSRNR
ncbi:MAG: hypothetical protein KA184_10405 [Candidatus Hydrogenedentes bacterium]|nr:hypothetical protein [Candidatus Hydrogenedentota bacterium]